jgi:hypothetical protein
VACNDAATKGEAPTVNQTVRASGETTLWERSFMDKTITRAAKAQPQASAKPDSAEEMERLEAMDQPVASRKRSPYFEDIQDEYKAAKGRGEIVSSVNDLMQHTTAMASLADVVRASVLRADYADNVEFEIGDPNMVSICPGNMDGLLLAQQLLANRAMSIADRLCELVSTEK